MSCERLTNVFLSAIGIFVAAACSAQEIKDDIRSPVSESINTETTSSPLLLREGHVFLSDDGKLIFLDLENIAEAAESGLMGRAFGTFQRVGERWIPNDAPPLSSEKCDIQSVDFSPSSDNAIISCSDFSDEKMTSFLYCFGRFEHCLKYHAVQGGISPPFFFSDAAILLFGFGDHIVLQSGTPPPNIVTSAGTVFQTSSFGRPAIVNAHSLGSREDIEIFLPPNVEEWGPLMSPRPIGRLSNGSFMFRYLGVSNSSREAGEVRSRRVGPITSRVHQKNGNLAVSPIANGHVRWAADESGSFIGIGRGASRFEGSIADPINVALKAMIKDADAVNNPTVIHYDFSKNHFVALGLLQKGSAIILACDYLSNWSCDRSNVIQLRVPGEAYVEP